MWWVALDLSSVMEPCRGQRSGNISKSLSVSLKVSDWWVGAHLVPLDDVFELTGLFLLNVRRQEHSGPGQTVILQEEKQNIPKHLVKRLLIQFLTLTGLDKNLF